MKKSLIAAALLGACMTPAVAAAQDAAPAVAEELTVGATVYGPEGAVVGTVEEVADGNVVVFTGKNRATLPANAFGKNEAGLLISMTKADLDAAVEAAEAQASAKIDAALVPDAQVHSTDGVAIAKVQKVEGDNVYLTLPDGDAIALKKDNLSIEQGGLKVFMTAAEFNAAVQAAAQPEAAASAEAGAQPEA